MEGAVPPTLQSLASQSNIFTQCSQRNPHSSSISNGLSSKTQDQVHQNTILPLCHAIAYLPSYPKFHTNSPTPPKNLSAVKLMPGTVNKNDYKAQAMSSDRADALASRASA